MNCKGSNIRFNTYKWIDYQMGLWRRANVILIAYQRDLVDSRHQPNYKRFKRLHILKALMPPRHKTRGVSLFFFFLKAIKKGCQSGFLFSDLNEKINKNQTCRSIFVI